MGTEDPWTKFKATRRSGTCRKEGCTSPTTVSVQLRAIQVPKVGGREQKGLTSKALTFCDVHAFEMYESLLAQLEDFTTREG